MKPRIVLPFTAAALALAACSHQGDANSADTTANSDGGAPGNIADDGNLSSGDLNAAVPLENTADANVANGGAGNAH